MALGLMLYVVFTRSSQQRRHPSAAIAWVLMMVVLPYAAIPLFLVFGSRKVIRPPAHLPQASPQGLPAQAPAWATGLLRALGVPDAAGNARVQFHADGAQSYRALLALIDAAHSELTLCTYVLGGGEVGREIAAALLRCTARGVRVRLLVDAVGGWAAPRTLLARLRRGGVQQQWFMPLLHNPMRGRTNLRNHRKTVIADGEWLWSGGRNLAAEYFVPQAGRPAWVDLSFEAQGALAAQAQAQFERDWAAATGQADHADSAAHVFPDTGAVLAQWVPSGPDHADDTVHALLLTAAFQARERLWLATPYFVPDDRLLNALCLASRRGVEVRLLIPRHSNHRIADIARHRSLRELVRAGARVLLSPDMLHAKAVWVDGELALCGSVNLDSRSLFLNYEAMAAFYGPQEIAWLGQWFDTQAARCSAYRAQQPGGLQDIFEGLVRTLGFQL